MGTGLIDAALEPTPFDFSGADAWSVLVLLDGTPVARVELPSPGSVGSPALVRAALARTADPAVARGRLIDDLLARIGAARPTATSIPTISVVLCTHRRPDDLPRALAALEQLDPAPAEIIVVDNAPGEADCHDIVASAGFRYIREDRQGLDNARNTGVRAATGDVIAFTDDDCVPSLGWLRIVPELFDDPSVGGATGPMFPLLLDTPSRVDMERAVGITRGFRRRTFDWQTISVVQANAIGVGANMAFRRSVLAELGDEPFPPELDAGTPTESGGDTFVIAQVIARGHRMVYAPEMFGFHRHRADPRALDRAVRGYGVGLSAAMCKLLLEHGEGEVWRSWRWLVAQYLRTQRGRIIGRADVGDARLAREYIVGGLLGPLRWRESLRTQRHLGPASLASVREAEPLAGTGVATQPAHAQTPRISIVIPTYRDLDVLGPCVDSLAAQTAPPGSFEVLVVDDADPPVLAADSLERDGLQVRLLQSPGAGASAARNLGAREAQAPLLLFLDDDMVAEPQLIERHLACHTAEQPMAVVGACPPAPCAPGLMASAAAFWWKDFFESMQRAVSPTFVSLLCGNLSIPRRALLDVGGFDLSHGREDWELGMRWLHAGYGIAYEPRARARHEFSLPTATRIRRAELEGYCDAVLVRRYPDALGALPLVAHRPLSVGPSTRRLGFALARRPVTQKVANALLELLESAHLRSTWQRLSNLLQTAAYARGLERGRYEPARVGEELVLDCDLLSEEKIEVSGPVAPTLRITLAGEELVRVRPRHGQWGPHVAEQIADALEPASIERVGAARGWLDVEEPPSEIAHSVEVITGPGGAPSDHWHAVASAAARSRSEIVALPMLGTRQDPRWLAEALVAFDGDRVGAVFGVAIGDDRPVQPLYLHDLVSPPRFEVGDAPSYLAVRTQVLRELGGAHADAARWGNLAPVMVIIQDILAAGEVVGRRDVHGLEHTGSAVSPLEEGRAWAAAQLCHAPSPSRTLAKGGAGLLATMLWYLFRQRGRVDLRRIGGMAGAAQGALWGAAAARAGLRSAPRSSGDAADGTPPSRPARHAR